MKRLFLSLLASVILLAACNNKKPNEVTVTTKDGDKVTIDANNAQNVATEMQKMHEELQKLPPLSLDQLKALVPEEMMGVKRSDYNATSAMGTASVTAKYKINDSTDVKLAVFDCAGPAGAGIYSMQYMTMFNMQSESDREYTKTVDFNDAKAIEHCRKDRDDCSFTYFSGKRFLVTLDGNNVGIDALKDAAKGLNIK